MIDAVGLSDGSEYAKEFISNRRIMLEKFTAILRDDSHAAESLRKMPHPNSFLDAPQLQIPLVDTRHCLTQYKPIAFKHKPSARNPELPLAPRFDPTLLLEKYKYVL